ncbi:hypothetical protein [Paenibacillus chitinolyticus]|uniref:hypothetical protein n=1 Tax=Paenibacillus chitinolyticus TaxID=79263 RepID=UPI00362AEBA6
MKHLDDKLLQDFRRFYESIPEKNGVYYLFFTTGLLHWAAKSLQFVPDTVPVVLIGAGLTEEEQIWVRQEIRRPFFCFGEKVDEGIVWHYLTAVNREDFGWLDIDCFVLNDRLFGEMARVPRSASVNCVWSYEYGKRTVPPAHFDFRVLRTFFLFINRDVIRELDGGDLPWSPRPFLLDAAPVSSSFKRYDTLHVLDDAHKRTLARILPENGDGTPVFPAQIMKKDGVVTRHLDTLVLYQLLAHSRGYPLHRVRCLDEDETALSDEVVHIGSVSYYRSFADPGYEVVSREERARYNEIYERVLLLDYTIVSQFERRLPRSYSVYRRMLERDIKRLGISSEHVKEEALQKLTGQGMSREAAERICGDPL